MDYIPKYKITADKLRQQLISGNVVTTSVEQYSAWVKKRADELAGAGNALLESLRGDLTLPAIALETQKQEHAFATA
jgi:hypothetical protein